MKRPKTFSAWQPARLMLLIPLLFILAFLPSTLLAENLNFQGFENGSIDNGWTTSVYSGSYDWYTVTEDLGFQAQCDPYDGNYMAVYDSWDAPVDDGSWLISPSFDLSDKLSATFSFWFYRDPNQPSRNDRLVIYINTSPNTDGATELETINRGIDLEPTVSSGGWYQYSYDLDLSTYNGTENYIIIEAISAYANEMYIDDLSIDAEFALPDAAITGVSTEHTPFHMGTEHIIATLENAGNSTMTSADFHWAIMRDSQVLTSGNFYGWTGYLAPGEATNVDIGTFDFTYPAGTTNFTPFMVTVAVDNVNGTDSDPNTSNNYMTVGLTPSLNDAAVVAMTRPGSGFAPGVQQVRFKIKNYAPRPLTSVTVNWEVDGVAQTPYNWTGNLAYNQEAELTLGSYNFPFKAPMGPFYITAWTEYPNGRDDEDPSNDSFTGQAAPSLAKGTFYVGGNGAHFADVQSAANYLAVGGVIGDGTLEFIIRPGTYDAHLDFADFARGNNSFIFRSESGNPSDVTINCDPALGERAMWRIQAVDNVEFRGLTFNLTCNAGHIFELTGGTQNITFTNDIFNSRSNAEPTPDNAIIYSYDNPNVSIAVSGSTLNNGSSGIMELTPDYKGAINVTKNTFMNQSLNAINILNARGSVISENTIRTTGAATKNGAIILTNGGQIVNNTITGFNGSQSDFNDAVISMRNDDPAAGEIMVENNTITNATNLHGIFIEAPQGTVNGNSVTITSNAGSDLGGLRIINSGDETGYLTVSGNRISSFGGSGLQAYGSRLKLNGNLFMSSGTDRYTADVMGSSGYAANNMFSGNDNNGARFYGSGTFELYYNTIVITSAAYPALELAYGDITLKRNLIINLGGGPAIKASNYSYAGSLTSDQNDIYTTGSVLASWDNTDKATLEDWQTASRQDLLSVSIAAAFKSVADLHLTKFSEGMFVEQPLELPAGFEYLQNYDYDNELRMLYFFGADNVKPEGKIIVQPLPLIGCIGAKDLEMSVVAEVSFGGTPRYQWEKDGIAIPGATEAILRLKTLTFDMSGLYRVKVYGAGVPEPMYSDPVLVYVLKPTEITRQPQSQFAENGSTIRVDVGTHVYNDLPQEFNPTFQWYRGTLALRDNDRIAGTRSSILSIRDIQPADFGDNYHVVITGLCGSVQSSDFSIKLPPGVDITVQSANVSACEGAGANISIDVTPTNGATESDLTYHWQLNGVNLTDGARISGSTTKSLIISNANQSDEGEYEAFVTIKTTGKVVPSQKISLDIQSKPSITTQPEPALTVRANDPLELEVVAVGDAPISYQWYLNNTPITGETNATFTKAAAAESDEGVYTVKVSNSCGEVTSNPATVTVTFTQMLSAGEAYSGGYVLMPNQPNPFNGRTIIRYFVPAESAVRITVNDAFGREIAELANKTVSAGEQSLEFNAADYNLSSGVYYYTLTAGSNRMTNRMVVVK